MKLAKASFSAISTLAFAAVAVAAGSMLTFSDQGTASLKVLKDSSNDMETIEITETRYFNLGYPTDFLAKAVIRTRRLSGAESADDKVTLEVRGNDKARFDKVMWTAQEDGGEVVFPGTGFVGIRQFGCCGASDITRLFNTKTGKKVEALASSLFEIEVPNSMLPNRFMGIALDSKAPAEFAGKSYIGTVTYFSNEKIISRARVYANLPAGWATDISELKLVDMAPRAHAQVVTDDGKRATLWGTDGVRDAAKAFSGFALSGTLYYASQVEKVSLVVNGDQIDAMASESTAGLALVYVK
jgi:hypothetical protein